MLCGVGKECLDVDVSGHLVDDMLADARGLGGAWAEGESEPEKGLEVGRWDELGA